LKKSEIPVHLWDCVSFSVFLFFLVLGRGKREGAREKINLENGGRRVIERERERELEREKGKEDSE
jgi:hypothetical protein